MIDHPTPPGRGGAGQRAELVAVVELGSTAARFVLARLKSSGRYKILDEERVSTRLGAGRPGTLSAKAIRETLRAVHRFLERHSLAERGPRMVAVATSAVRDATNRERLLGPLRFHEGIDVQVLSAHDEARLGVRAALETLDITGALVADLGGASPQLSRVRARRVASIATLPLGAVRTTGRFLRHDPPCPRELRALRTTIRAHLARTVPAARRGEVMVGLGGTVRSLASIHVHGYLSRRKRHGLLLRQSDVTAIRERLERLSSRKRRKIRGLKRERADIILAGAIAIEEVMLLGGYLRLLVCMHGVRDGVLLREAATRRR